MARIYEKLWQGGKHQDLGPGHHYQQEYKQGVNCLIVPKGQKVTIYEKPDKTGKKYNTFTRDNITTSTFMGQYLGLHLHLQTHDHQD